MESPTNKSLLGKDHLITEFKQSSVKPCYLGGAQGKGFATIRNVSKLTFLGPDWVRKVCTISVLVELLRAKRSQQNTMGKKTWLTT